MAQPLEGIRVIDCTNYQLGPLACMMLGDLGAEVIHVEERIGGDGSRSVANMAGLSMKLPHDLNAFYESMNRNKKSITLDLKNREGLEVLYRLLEKSDVFVHNFRHGVAERMGISYEVLSKYNSKLIYASSSPYGTKGADSTRRSLDPVAGARAGIMMTAATPEGFPLYPPGNLADQTGGIMLAYAILVALIARERQGVGQKVETSILASLAWLQGLSLQFRLLLGQEYPRWRREEANALNTYYLCADGKWLRLGLFQWHRHWSPFCKAMGIEELEKDPRFGSFEQMLVHSKELTPLLDKIFATKTREEWLNIFKNYPDLIYEPVNSISDLLTDPQMLENDYIVTVDHPVLGTIKMVGLPLILSKTPVMIRTTAPEFGQHTEEVLQKVCGYSWEEIVELKNNNVI